MEEKARLHDVEVNVKKLQKQFDELEARIEKLEKTK